MKVKREVRTKDVNWKDTRTCLVLKDLDLGDTTYNEST